MITFFESKKYLLILIILISFTQKSFGQETDLKIINARDYATARVVYVYLNEYFLNPNSAHNDAYDVKKLNFNLIKNLFEKNTIDYPVSIDSVSSILSSFGFNNLDTLFVRKVKIIAIDKSKPDSEIANSLVESIYAVNFNITSAMNANVMKYVLKKEIENYFYSPPSKASQVNNIQLPKPVQLEVKSKPDFTNLGIITCSVIASATICIVLIYLLYHRLLSRKNIQLPIRKYQSDDNKQIVILITKIKELEFSLKEVQNKVHEFINTKQQQTAPDIFDVKPKSKKNDSPLINYLNYDLKEKETGTFYLHSPFNDTFLNDTKSVSIKSGLFSYKFTLYEEKEKAYFELVCNAESLQMINSFRKKLELLQPACNIENLTSEFIVKIATVIPGIAKLDGENWKIIKKATIKFEYTKQPTKSNSNSSNITNSNDNKDADIFIMTSAINGIFHKYNKSSDYIQGYIRYRFFKCNQLDAEFELISDEETIKVVKSNIVRDSTVARTITDYCKLENTPNYHTFNILTIKKGIAKFESDRWKIIEKSIIKFENGNEVKFQNKVSLPKQTELMEKIIIPIKTVIINKIITPLQNKNSASKFFIFYFGAWGVLGIMTLVIISFMKYTS